MKKQKILIADDSEMNRSILADMLGNNYEIIEAEDGVQAISVLKSRASEISLLLLDIVMPKLDGFGVLNVMSRNGWIDEVPVIIITSENSQNHVEMAYNLGATDFISRPFDMLIVRKRVANTILLHTKQTSLISMLERRVYEKEHQSDLMINILSHIMEFRNGESDSHILHIRALTDLFLRWLMWNTDRYKLTMSDIALISAASALHDIGKIGIDEKILTKPGKLTPEEFEVIKSHSAIGANMISSLPIHKQEPLVRAAYEICRWHHERYDGSGYPDGLKGDKIPISAQVVALADVYDKLTSARVYRPPFTHEEAVEMITRGECGAFNPLLIQCLRENGDSLSSLMQHGANYDIKSNKLHSISEEMFNGEGGGASTRTIKLLERERMRNSFYASLTEAIQFEIIGNPPMLTLSVWGAKKLGLDENIIDPGKDSRIKNLLVKTTWAEFAERVRSTTPENPELKFDLKLHVDGNTRWHRVVTRSFWSDDDIPVFEGAIGCITDIHDTRLKILELEKKASYDALTGVLNRASAVERIEFMMLERPESNYAFAIIDIDFFKNVNDIYGHVFGDEVLQHFAKCLRSSIRGTDVSGRFGGEEFMFFLEYKTDIERTIDRIFHSICSDYKGYHISVTMGVALSKDVGAKYEDLLRAADTALYAGKRGGRAQYRFYDDLLKNLLESGTAYVDTVH